MCKVGDRLWHYIKKHSFFIATAILIAILAVVATSTILPTDIFYSVKVGEWIASHGIDMKDHFSIHNNLPYTYPHWLFDFLIYWVYHFTGFIGIYILTCIMAIALMILLYIISYRLSPGRNKLIAFIVTLIATIIMSPFFTARAQMPTYILLLLAVYLIERFLRQRKLRYTIGLVVIPWLIANYHVAVYPFYIVIFLPYLGEYLTGLILRRVKHSHDSKFQLGRLQISIHDNAKYLFPIIAVSALVGLLTPLGTVPYTYLYKTMIGSSLSYITEHLPLVLSLSPEILIPIIATVIFLIFTKVKIRLCDLFAMVGYTYLTLSSRRQEALLVLFGSVIVCRLVSRLWQQYNVNNKIATQLIHIVIKPIAIVDIAVIICIVIASQAIAKQVNQSVANTSSYPVAVSDYIVSNLDVKKIRLYNQYDYGGYILYRDIPVFIDPRADLYTKPFNGREDIFTDYMNADKIDKVYFEKIFHKYKITHVLVVKSSHINTVIAGQGKQSNYQKLYEKDGYVLYKRLKDLD